MATNVTYRSSGAVVPSTTTVKNSVLLNSEIDGNFKSLVDAVDARVVESELASSTGAAMVGYQPTTGESTNVQDRLRTHDTALSNVEGNLNFTTLPSATLPVADTDTLLIRQGSSNKKMDMSVVRSELATNAVAAAASAQAAKIAAEGARDAAIIGSGVYATEAAGRAAVADGVAFKVQGSGEVAAYEYRRTNSTTSVLIATYPSLAGVNNWFRQTLGAFFFNPHYEFSGANLYFKPGVFGGVASFYTRGGYLPDVLFTYEQVKASILAQSPAIDPAFIELDAVSPFGVTDCILLKPSCAIWYNPSTNTFFAGNRNVKRQNEVLMIHNDNGRVGPCEEQAQMYARLERFSSVNEAWKYECPIITSIFSPYFPNVDTVNGTFTIPSDTLLFFKNTWVSIPATSVSLSGFSSTALRVFYNSATNSFVVKVFSASLTEFEKLTLVLVATMRYTGTNTGVSIGCPYTVNGLTGGIALNDKSTQFAAIFTSNINVTKSTNYPNYDTSSRTFTLYSDTVLTFGNTKWILSADQSIVVSTSTANKVYWDTATNTLQTAMWSADLTDAQRITYVQVAVIRSVVGVDTVISMMCPYTVNKKLFGRVSDEPNPVDALVLGVHHRGFSGIAPENTLPAYRESAKVYNMWVEGDIQYTSDNVPVLLHDSTIDRTSNGTGAIAGMTLATAKTYDFGSWKGAAFAGTTIPTWDETLRLLKKLGLRGMFELKVAPSPTQLQAVLASIKKTGMKGAIQLDCFTYSVLQDVVAADPTQDVGYLGNLSSAFIAQCVGLKTGQNRVTAAASSGSVTQALVEEAHQNGVRVVCWTVDTASQVPGLAAAGVDGIMTNTLNIASILRSSENL